MMTNEDREFNRTCMTEHIHRGVLTPAHLTHNNTDADLRLFQLRLKEKSLGLTSLYAIINDLKAEIRLLRCIEHDVLSQHYAIHDMQLFRQAYRENEELFRIAKNCIRAKIRLTMIYIDKEWENMERSTAREE